MDINKELKEKLFKAGNADEVKALLNEQAENVKEAASKLWDEIQSKKGAEDLKELAEDELESVAGGFGLRLPDAEIPRQPRDEA